MPWRNRILYFVVTATLTFLQLCDGHAVQRPSAPGSIHFKRVRHESVGPTRHGSLVLKTDEQGHQRPTPVLHNLMGAKLKQMNPSVQCSDNLMTLRVKRVGAPHFLVDSGEGAPTPLSQMPSKCGFSVRRSRRDVSFVAPYQGCHVTQQGGNYVLPLRLLGAPMTMSCPSVLPPPSVTCFPSGMVVKIGNIGANQLKVKVEGTWKSLSSVCSSCGLSVEVVSGGLTLSAPYNRGSCIETEDEKYLLSLLLTDAELLVTCPSLQDVKPTPITPPSDSGQVPQYPQYPQYPQFPQLPMFPQYPAFPGSSPPAHTPAPTTAIAPLPQHPQMPLGAATDSKTENQAAQYPAFPLMPQYPQFPQYPVFPSPEPPTQPTPNKNTAAPLAQFPQMPQYPQYPYPFFPIVPGIFPPTPPPPPPAEALVTKPPPATKHDEKPHVPQQPQFLMPPQYPLLPFPKLPLPTEGQTQAFQDPKPVQQPKPYQPYPQTYQIPVLYPPSKYPSQSQNTQMAAPGTTSTTTAATTLNPAAQKPFYYPHPYMPQYYVPQQAPMPVFPDPPTTPNANPAPSDQQEHQPVYRAMPPFYPFLSYQRPKSFSRNR